MASRSGAREGGFSLLELSLAIAIGLTVLASGFWMVKQHNAEARVQQSKMLLATIRTNLAAYRYRFGTYPSVNELQRNWATSSTNQASIVQVASRSQADITTYGGAISEPVSGVGQVLSSTNSTTANTGGWVYNSTNGTLQVNLDPAKYPGDNPALW